MSENNEPIFSLLTGKSTECTVNNYNDSVNEYVYISGGPEGSEGCYERDVIGGLPEIDRFANGGFWNSSWDIANNSIIIRGIACMDCPQEQFTIDLTQNPNFVSLSPNYNLFSGTYTDGTYTINVSCGCG